MYVKQGGAQKQVLQGWIKQGGVVKQFFSSATGPALSIAPSSWTDTYPEGAGTQSQIFSVTVNFGTGPYTYVWSYINTSGSNVVLASGAGTATTTWQVGNTALGQIRCQVTDSLAVTNTINANVNVTFGTPP